MKNPTGGDTRTRDACVWICDGCHRRVRVCVPWGEAMSPPRNWIIEYNGTRHTCSPECSAKVAERANAEADEAASKVAT